MSHNVSRGASHMISLKRNSKGQLIQATGRRTRNIYDPTQINPFRLSRSKFSDFLQCPRCFYLDRVTGLSEPSTPGWSLNQATDDLLKKEFDNYRELQEPHPIFSKFGLHNIVPFSHQDLELWRDSLHHGLQYQIPGSNIMLHGGIDDVWVNQSSGEVIIVDYKSQASLIPVTTDFYLAGRYHQGYKIQMDFYGYLLQKMGFQVSPIGYFYVCNAKKDLDGFHGQLLFEETLVPYEWDGNWIDGSLGEMINILLSSELPESEPACENCAYAHQRAHAESPSNMN